jgi:hypothetical protein
MVALNVRPHLGAKRVSSKSPVRENRSPGSVRGHPGNRVCLPRYNPSTGRWLNRDPIEEQGGLNLFNMIKNDGVNQYDFLGLFTPCGKFVVRTVDDVWASATDGRQKNKPFKGFEIAYISDSNCCPCKNPKISQAIHNSGGNSRGWRFDTNDKWYVKNEVSDVKLPPPPYIASFPDNGVGSHGTPENPKHPSTLDSPHDGWLGRQTWSIEACAICYSPDKTWKNLGCVQFKWKEDSGKGNGEIVKTPDDIVVLEGSLDAFEVEASEPGKGWNASLDLWNEGK